MNRSYKYSLDFLPSGDVQLRLDGSFTTATSLKIFELLAADTAKQASVKRPRRNERTKRRPEPIPQRSKARKATPKTAKR